MARMRRDPKLINGSPARHLEAQSGAAYCARVLSSCLSRALCLRRDRGSQWALNGRARDASGRRVVRAVARH